MKKHDVIAFETIHFEGNNPQINSNLLEKLYRFVAQYYHLTDINEFKEFIIQPKEPGELNVFLGLHDDVAGFSRTIRQQIKKDNQVTMVYVAHVYLNPQYKTYPTIGSMGLTQCIQHKLANPHDEIIYLTFASNPTTYEFVFQLSDAIYPKPNERVPEQIIDMVNVLKRQNGWLSTSSHPMVVNSLLVPCRNQPFEFKDKRTQQGEFYLATNPDFMQGNTLLTYVPLHLTNINYGLNLSDSTPHTVRSPAEPVNQYVERHPVFGGIDKYSH